ncbi:alpha/beta-hydrolase [Cadophora sp. DSE1049]|nr:alpha/beta-hydrolase [Cadophora sp. DSE1049]
MTPTPVSVKINEFELNGFVSPQGVANFLNVPYASVPARFRQAIPLDPRKQSGVHDATKYGARAPQVPNDGDKLRSHLNKGIADPSSYPVSEFDGLRLNIYTPLDAISSKKELPIFVWIHGGGWTLGDANGAYNANNLVEHSIKIGKLFIYVAIGFRLGYAGFLTSRELQEEAHANGEVGYANQGLHDQRLGLQWIQNNISSFGGNGQQITIAGESSGAWSVVAHLRSKVAVTQQAFVLSHPVRILVSQEESQATFDRLVASTGVAASATAAGKLAALRKLTNEQLASLLQGPFAFPIADKNWFGDDSTSPIEQRGPFPEWAKNILVGYTKDEIALFGLAWTEKSLEEIEGAFKKITDQSYAEEIKEAYGISGDATSARNGVLQYISDIEFARAPFYLEDNAAGKTPVAIYRFDQPDTFPNSVFKGYAFHSLDSAFFNRLPAVAGPDAPAELRKTADQITGITAEFVAVKLPWEEYRVNKKITLLGGPTPGFGYSPVADVEKWRKLTNTLERLKKFSMSASEL